MNRNLFSFVLVACTVFVCGCHKAGESSSKSAAKKPATVDEKKLNTVTLTEQAEQRIGIRLSEAAMDEVPCKRTVGGEVVVPPGRALVIASPVAGEVLAPETGTVPGLGSQLEEGQVVFRFRPLLTPERDVLTPAEQLRAAQTRADIATAQLEAERQMATAKIGVETSQLAYDRAVKMFNDKAGSQRTVDEADAQLRLARETYTTAKARYDFLSGLQLDEQAGELTIRTIASPIAGVLQHVNVSVGQTVATGDPLFEVVALDDLWVRVPVFVGRLREIDTNEVAQVGEYGQASESENLPARYVPAPPSADPTAATVDVFYRLENSGRRFCPGQKVAVQLPLLHPAKSLVVPWSAIIYDIYGGAWVYECVAPQTYARQRVEVKYVDKPLAVLARGPRPGAQVVAEGADLLFGAEFGVGK